MFKDFVKNDSDSSLESFIVNQVESFEKQRDSSLHNIVSQRD